MKNGSQQATNPPTTMLRVCAVFVSRRNEDTRVAGSKFRTDTSRFRDSGRERLVALGVYRLAVRCGVNASELNVYVRLERNERV